jgi:hypothetical protein
LFKICSCRDRSFCVAIALHARCCTTTTCTSHTVTRAGIEALPDELREGRRVQRIANVLNRKHRAAQ